MRDNESDRREPGEAEALEAMRAGVARAVLRAIARLERRMRAVDADLARVAEAAERAAFAQRFVAEAARARRGARVLRAVDWSSGEARSIELAVDPAKTARAELDAIFRRAKRLKGGAPVAQARLADARMTADRLRGVLDAIGVAESPDELDALGEQAHTIAPRDVRRGSAGSRTAGDGHAPHGETVRAPYRTFLGSNGARILVGKSAEKNDRLTLDVARPGDLWLHARGMKGAHVVVPLAKGKACPSELLVEAAHLAAHFSDARKEALVEIVYVPRRYVRKPRKSPPGLVVLQREKTMLLKVDARVLGRLLEREELAT
jgi:predicted ribosome quality control (RQC) complex YloA/Tae2 family protein